MTAECRPARLCAGSEALQLQELHLDEPARMKWLRHWLDLGSRAIEDVLARDQCTGRFCFGGRTTIADINAKMLCDSEPAPYCPWADHGWLANLEGPGGG
jgi:glutathione S-transferase